MIPLNEIFNRRMPVLEKQVQDCINDFLFHIDKVIPGNDKRHIKFYKFFAAKVNQAGNEFFKKNILIDDVKFTVIFDLTHAFTYGIGGEMSGRTKTISVLIPERRIQLYLSAQENMRLKTYWDFLSDIKSALIHEITHAYQEMHQAEEEDDDWHDADLMDLLDEFWYFLYLIQPIEVQAITSEALTLYNNLRKKGRRKSGVSLYRCILAKYSAMISGNDFYVRRILNGEINLQQFLKKEATVFNKFAIYYILACVIRDKRLLPRFSLLTNDPEYQEQVLSRINSIDVLRDNCKRIIKLLNHFSKDDDYKLEFTDLIRKGIWEGWTNRLFFINKNNDRLVSRIWAAMGLRRES